MRLLRSFLPRAAALGLGLLLGGLPTYAATAGGGYAGHEVIAGDFNGDGWMDFILQAVSDYFTNAEFIADGDDGDDGYTAPAATWPNEHAGVDWNAGAHKILVGDFNGDGRDDLFLQGASGLGSAVLLANAAGRFTRIAEVPPRTIGGLDFSQAGHRLVAGDFNGDGRDDLLLQATSAMTNDGIALAASDGSFEKLAASWRNGVLGLHWTSNHAVLVAGDFNGSGRTEILTRTKAATQADAECCRIVSFGPSQQPQKIVQNWKTNYLGIDWSPARYRIVTGDLNSDGRDDLLLQPTEPGGDISILFANAKGVFTRVAARWPAAYRGNDWSTQSYRILIERAGVDRDANLVLVPMQAGLPYERAALDKSGTLDQVTTLASPPPTLAGMGPAGNGNPGGNAAPKAAGGLAAHGADPNTGSDAVGALPGKFSVGASGGVSYRIPIAVAPGVNGVKPDLAVVYNSRQGGSQLGLGWALSGLAAITRCPATVASDGYAKAPDFTDSDRFCLGGTHLHVYGGAGTHYYTKPASFQRIVSHGTQGHGPAWFEVWSKGGTISDYGHTDDSAISAGYTFDNSTAIWLLDKTTDRYGSFISYHYLKDTPYSGVDQSYRLNEVDYGNKNGTIVGKLVFDYSTAAPSAYHVIPYFASGIEHLHYKYVMTGHQSVFGRKPALDLQIYLQRVRCGAAAAANGHPMRGFG